MAMHGHGHANLPLKCIYMPAYKFKLHVAALTLKENFLNLLHSEELRFSIIYSALCLVCSHSTFISSQEAANALDEAAH